MRRYTRGLNGKVPPVARNDHARARAAINLHLLGQDETVADALGLGDLFRAWPALADRVGDSPDAVAGRVDQDL